MRSVNFLGVGRWEWFIGRFTVRPGNKSALKLIIPEFASNPMSMQMFVREANLLCQIRHPRVVEFFEMGMDREHCFIAMEFVEPLDIASAIHKLDISRRIPIACGLVSFVLEGLDFIHRHDIVHRDVKPSNILAFKNDGKTAAKIADFGLAKNYMNAGFSGITQENEAKGTLACMPPEQIIDCRGSSPGCDIYAVGATLYYYLTGLYPHQKRKGEATSMADILNSEPIEIDSRVGGIPPELGAIVMRSLHREPQRRYSSAQHFRDALQAYIKS